MLAPNVVNTRARFGSWFARWPSDRVDGGEQLAQPDAGAILHLHLEAAGVADAAHRRRRHDDDEGLLDRLQAPEQVCR